MTETLEQVQQQAYAKGQEIKQRHRQLHCVLPTKAAITILSADFAQVSLLIFLRQPSITDAHHRAHLCALAFQRGYAEL